MFSTSAIIIYIGLLQGIFEAFPISSSMHLMMFTFFTKNKHLEISIMHLASAVAFMLLLWPFIWRVLKNIYKPFYIKISFKILVMIIPTIITGFFLKDHQFDTSKIAYYNLFAGLSMLIADRSKRINSIISLNLIQCLIISMITPFALIPGISRMGITYTALRIFQMRRKDAFFITLLMGIPLTLGASLIKIFQTNSINMLSTPILFGLTISTLLTFLFTKLTFAMINRFWIFAIYRIALSTILILI